MDKLESRMDKIEKLSQLMGKECLDEADQWALQRGFASYEEFLKIFREKVINPPEGSGIHEVVTEIFKKDVDLITYKGGFEIKLLKNYLIDKSDLELFFKVSQHFSDVNAWLKKVQRGKK